MRKISFAALFLLVLLAIVSCSEESGMDLSNGSDTGNIQSLAFVFEGINQSGNTITYGESDVLGIGNEKIVNDITVYVFDRESVVDAADGVLRLVKTFTGLGGVTGKVTLDMGRHPMLKGEYIAYFIANNVNERFVDMTGVTEGTTLESQFHDLSTVRCTDITNDLFLMTGRTASSFIATGTHAVQLRARVARFDLINKNPDLTITQLIVRNANDQVNTFANASNLVSCAQVHPTPITTFAWADHFDGKIHEGLFYLYPTTIASTKIYVEGYTGTEGVDKQSFLLELSSDVLSEIKANYRYILTIDADPSFTIGVAEWNVAENTEYVSPGGFDRADIWGAGVLDRSGYILAVEGGITITLKATSMLGASYTITPVTASGFILAGDNDFTVTESISATITYGQPYYKADYQVSWNPSIRNQPFISKLRFTDRNSDETLDFVLYYHTTEMATTYYPGTALNPVTVNGITWAPVNIGATIATEAGTYKQWCHNTHVNSIKPYIINGPVDRYPGVSSVLFIANRDNLSVSNGDWFVTDNPMDRATINGLWKMPTQQPCPSGYRVPTLTELKTLLPAPYSYNTNDRTIRINGDDQDTYLELPLAGYLDRKNAVLTESKETGYYWSSDIGEVNQTQSIALKVTSDALSIIESPRANAYSLRCVKSE